MSKVVKLGELVFEDKQLLLCGGLGGHLMHLYDNPDLSFAELKGILTSAAEGQLEKTTEKLDGQNIFFSFNVSDNSLRFARNKGDLQRGGMTREEVTSKWAGKPAVQAAFTGAFDIMNEAVSSLSPEDKAEIFGQNTEYWYSAEILATVNPNVINYDRNVIIPHEFGVQKLTKAGVSDPEFQDTAPQFEKLRGVIDRLQKVASQRGWAIMEPQIFPLKKLSDKSILSSAIARLDALLGNAGMNDSQTIGEYIQNRLATYMARSGIPSDIAMMVGKRMLDTPDKPTKITQLKQLITKPGEYEKVVAIDKNKEVLFKEFIKPIELLISDFAIDLLKGAESLIALHPDQTVRTMKDSVAGAIRGLEANKDSAEFLQTQLAKLRGLDNITTSMEGIVFRYKGNSYKFVGAFAPINQLLGAFRFGGRGGIEKQ